MWSDGSESGLGRAETLRLALIHDTGTRAVLVTSQPSLRPGGRGPQVQRTLRRSPNGRRAAAVWLTLLLACASLAGGMLMYMMY